MKQWKQTKAIFKIIKITTIIKFNIKCEYLTGNKIALIVFQIIGMKSNMNDDRKVMLGNANNPIPNIIKPDMVKEAWNYAALTKVITALGTV